MRPYFSPASSSATSSLLPLAQIRRRHARLRMNAFADRLDASRLRVALFLLPWRTPIVTEAFDLSINYLQGRRVDFDLEDVATGIGHPKLVTAVVDLHPVDGPFEVACKLRQRFERLPLFERYIARLTGKSGAGRQHRQQCKHRERLFHGSDSSVAIIYACNHATSC
ncbi:hypothetical protein CHELA17_62756 [Chelatococcus asaccharovorans]|nr:hypothetical protein CHELA17_62756 [Chelatococcus asaccharovorans]